MVYCPQLVYWELIVVMLFTILHLKPKLYFEWGFLFCTKLCYSKWWHVLICLRRTIIHAIKLWIIVWLSRVRVLSNYSQVCGFPWTCECNYVVEGVSAVVMDVKYHTHFLQQHWEKLWIPCRHNIRESRSLNHCQCW